MSNNLKSLFGHYFDRVEVKQITKTDKEKNAIVLTKRIINLLSDHKINPEISPSKKYHDRRGEMVNGEKIVFSYYYSTRKEEGRVPEARIGKRDLISKIHVGDVFYVCEKGAKVLFHVDKGGNPSAEIDRNIAAEDAAAAVMSKKQLYKRAQAKHFATQRIGKSYQFIRSPDVAAFIKKASDYKCQMPGCQSQPFMTKQGKRYIEVHHIKPLREGGADRIENCAALCPRCHRLLHHGEGKEQFRAKLMSSMTRTYVRWAREYK